MAFHGIPLVRWLAISEMMKEKSEYSGDNTRAGICGRNSIPKRILKTGKRGNEIGFIVFLYGCSSLRFTRGEICIVAAKPDQACISCSG